MIIENAQFSRPLSFVNGEDMSATHNNNCMREIRRFRRPRRTNPSLSGSAGSRASLSIFRVVLPAVFAVLILSGCAGTSADKAMQPAFAPPKQLSVSQSVPYPEPGPKPASLAPTGSLWGPAGGSLFADLKAAKVGDVITITITEESKASKAATTTAARDKNFSGQFNFSGVGVGSNVGSPKGAVALGPYEGKFSNSFKGDGATSKTDSMSAYMTATVVDVLPNGNLLVRGSRWTKVNDEMQQLILEGIVRPVDINRNNSVLSQNVAEAKIFLVGKGPVTQHQKPGWLGQLLDFVSPF